MSPDKTMPIVADDAALVHGAAMGGPDALGPIYDRYAGRLLAFCQSMLGADTDTADADLALHAVFVIVATRISELHDPNMLRAWLFAIARNECSNRLASPDFAARRPTTMDGRLDGRLDGLGDGDAAFGALLPDADDGVPYDERVLLELADRQDLTDDEVAAAIGVPRPDSPGLIDRARRRSRGRLPANGRAFAPEMAGLRNSILAAAVAASAAVAAAGGSWPTSLIGAGWNGAWPPADAAFTHAFTFVPAAEARRRRWGAPLAVLVVLLIAIGAAIGLTNVGGSGHPAAQVTLIEPTTSPHSSALFPSASSSSADPTETASQTAASATVAAPPAPASASSPSASSSAPPSAASWVVTVRTDKHAIRISSGQAHDDCPANNSCLFQVPNNAVVTVADSDLVTNRLARDQFSAPASCTQSAACTVVITSAVTFFLTTPGSTVPTGRNH